MPDEAPVFPKNYVSRSFVIGGPTGEIVTKMVLEDGTVLGPDAKPIPGTGPQVEETEPVKGVTGEPLDPKPKKKRYGGRKAAEAASRLEDDSTEEV